MSVPERTAWDRHWDSLPQDRRLFGRIAEVVRRTILSRAVRTYVDRYFPPEGFFVEAGVGSGQSAERIAGTRRRLIALDFSLPALAMARREGAHAHLVCADARALPFRPGSLAGIWNLGVVEHFEPDVVDTMLREFRRAMRPGANAVLFWPPRFGSSRLVLGPLEWLRSRGRDTPFRFFPDEVNRVASKRDAAEAMRRAGLEPVTVDFTPRDAFIHVVAVGRRPG